MKRPALLLLPACFVTTLLSSCVTNDDPDNLENTIIAQDEKMKKKIEKAEARQESWDSRWENYSRKQDAKYDAWLDRAFN
ncbi:MAG: hypothetical protein P1U68_16660 [Verrucomicrobiales bacterium]|nr:hypothetical protein [Verrucomicrobiales bacterium]